MMGTLRDLILKHEKDVRAVMEQLSKHRLVASYNKGQLFRLTVDFVGTCCRGGFEGQHREI